MNVFRVSVGVTQANWILDRIRVTILNPRDLWWARRIQHFEKANPELVGYVFH